MDAIGVFAAGVREVVASCGTSLTAQHVQTLLNAKLRSGLAPRTVHHLRAILRRALNQAHRWGLVPRTFQVPTTKRKKKANNG